MQHWYYVPVVRYKHLRCAFEACLCRSAYTYSHMPQERNVSAPNSSAILPWLGIVAYIADACKRKCILLMHVATSEAPGRLLERRPIFDVLKLSLYCDMMRRAPASIL